MMLSVSCTLRLLGRRQVDVASTLKPAFSKRHLSHIPVLSASNFARQSQRQTLFSWEQNKFYCAALDTADSGAFEELSVQDLSKMLQNPGYQDDVQFVDVREPWEVETSSLPFFKNLPLGKLLNGGEDLLDADKPTVLLCHHGIRSRTAGQHLLEQGFEKVFNVTGGIDAYAKRVNSEVPLY